LKITLDRMPLSTACPPDLSSTDVHPPHLAITAESPRRWCISFMSLSHKGLVSHARGFVESDGLRIRLSDAAFREIGSISRNLIDPIGSGAWKIIAGFRVRFGPTHRSISQRWIDLGPCTALCVHLQCGASRAEERCTHAVNEGFRSTTVPWVATHYCS
jgi:hypothetical protein